VSDEPWVPRGISHERTFQTNLTDRNEIRRELSRLVTELMSDVHTDGRSVMRVIVKVRFAPFFTQQHGRKLPEPTADATRIDRVARALLDLFDDDRPIRLLGVRGEFAEVPESPAIVEEP
jgi:DNA polymerase-4